MRWYILIVCSVFLGLVACRKEDGPRPPEQVQLTFPEQNSECTTGQSLGETTSRVTFRWQEADHVDVYELRVTNINTGTVQTISTPTSSASLPIAKGTPFSWVVQSRNNRVTEVVSSAAWNFYNAGSVTSFAPFPADIVAPRMSERLFKDVNNEVTLSWTGSDLDNDIATYEVFFATVNPPSDRITTLGAGTTLQKVTVVSNTVYYWSVITKDGQGNETSSGVYSFQVL